MWSFARWFHIRSIPLANLDRLTFGAALWGPVVPAAYSAHSGALAVCSRIQVEKNRHWGNRLLWMHSVKGQHKSKWILLQSCPVVHKKHIHLLKCIHLIWVFSPFTAASVLSSHQFVLCVSEPFTLLRTQKLKRRSMGCLSLIVEWCTCPLPVLQVSS